MKARLKVLPDAPRGGAWPPSARTVRRPLKCGNERDPRPQLPVPPAREGGTLGGLPAISRRKGRATVGQYAPKPPGYTRATMGGTMGPDPERGRESPKPALSSDRGLQLARVKLESLVPACHHRAANTSLLLAHTARHSTRAESG